MKYCQECGKEIFDDAMICPNCGTYQTVLKNDSADNSSDVGDANLNMPDSVESRDRYQYQPMDQSGYRADDQSAYRYGDPAWDSHGPGSQYGQPGGQNAYTYSSEGMDSRFSTPGMPQGMTIRKYNFWMFFFLSIITCGIFGIYYMYKWTEDTNTLSQGVYKPSMNYIFVFLLGLVTCGIYPLVWTYQQGERLKVVGEANGIRINESGIHHLLLVLLLSGVGSMVSQYIFFSNTNRLSSVYNGESSRDAANQKTSHVAAIVIGILAGVIAFGTFIGTTIFLTTRYYDTYQYNFDYNDLENWEDFDWDNLEWEDFDSDISEGYISTGTIATIDDSTVEILDALVIKDMAGEPAIAVTFQWSNGGEEIESAMWKFDIEARQGDKRLETTWPASGDSDVDMSDYIKDVEPGEGTTFQVVFRLVDDKTPVDLQVKGSLTSDKHMAECRFTL